MQCNRCKVHKDQDEFDSGQLKCKKCAEYCLTYYKENRDKEIARATKNINKDRKLTNFKKRGMYRKNPIVYILCGAKARAKEKGLPFNLTHEDIVIPVSCPVFGTLLEIGNGRAHANSPSIDRIIPELGYVKGNIRIISHKANTMRSNATLEDLKILVRYLETKETRVMPEGETISNGEIKLGRYEYIRLIADVIVKYGGDALKGGPDVFMALVIADILSKYLYFNSKDMSYAEFRKWKKERRKGRNK
jgi:hypothetical protein